MNRTLKVVYLSIFFTALALPLLHFFGVKETWRQVYGAESTPECPSFTLKGFADRSYQNTLTEHYARSFFLRSTFYITSRQLNEAANFGLFHPEGYSGNTIEGKAFDERGIGVIFEDPYAKYHLTCERPFNPKRYGKVLALLKDFDDYCRTNGMDFVFLSVPDKPQTYHDYLPDWMKWLWNYENFPIQTYMTKLFQEKGIKAVDGLESLMALRRTTDKWLYPPGGTHLTCIASAHLQAEIVKAVNAGGRLHLENNPLKDVVEKPNAIWSVDNDISDLLNTWYNPHIESNIHYFPVFAKEVKTLNEGSAFLIGDCYRDQLSQIFIESGLFAKGKVLKSKRQNQRPEDFKPIISDLKLVVLVFQSFNSGQLDERYDELKTILTALRAARAALAVNCQIMIKSKL